MLEHIFPGDSEMAGRMRALDWSKTDLGSPENWPENQRIALSICLTSRFPMQVWWGPNLTMLYNDAYIPFLGSGKHPRALGRSARDIWSEIWHQIGPMLEQVVTAGIASWSEDIQMFFNRKTPKEEVYVSFSFSPIFEVRGGVGSKVEGAFCACTEVTEKVTQRKVGEEALRASEEQRRLALNSAELGTWHVNPETMSLKTDERFRAIFGVPAEQLGYEQAVAIIHPDDRARVRDAVAAATQPDYPAPYAIEYRVVHPDGSIHWVFAKGRANFQGEAPARRLVSFDGTVADITERKQAEQAVLESKERFRAIADNIPQLAWMANGDGWVDWFNRGWLEYTGTTLEENLGLGWKAVHHPDYVDAVAENFERHLRDGRDWEDTFPLRGKDGRYRWFLSRMKAIRDESGKVVRFFGTNTDVTEQLATEEALKESDRRKTEFLAMLAHELRNPLAPIRNALEILRLPGRTAQAVQLASEMMGRQIGQMVRLVDDLLDVSRISRGKIELRRGRIELQSAVHHAVEAARAQYKSMNHELAVTLPPEPIFLNGDPIRLTQVVGNLLNNACKFTDKGGRIELTVEREVGQVVIRVRDGGIGIAADQLPRIFDMFVQVDSSLERSVSGLGIGLTLVKNLVELHDGTVEVHSAGLGHGAEFVVRLPILEDTPTPPPPEPTVGKPMPAAARRILVVDDNRDSATSLAMLLKLTGSETYIAYDGVEAVEVAATFKPDVVLIDIGLPKLNGYEAVRTMRNNPWGKKMAVVALTGWGQEEFRQKSKDAGFDGHLVKPVTHAALMKMLGSLSPE